MDETTDSDLVRQFVGQQSESAFAELVRRHVNLVYSVARRLTGDPEDAQDAVQAVFLVLARKARGLQNRTTITGWLYETTRLVCAGMVRSRSRRQLREQEAYMQSTTNNPDGDDLWKHAAPILEEGMARLDERDRTLLALRFFENKTAAETARLLGMGEWAAHKRTSRALEKLRQFFQKRGIESTAASLGAALSANSIQAAPVNLAASATSVALGKGAMAGSSLTLAKGALKVMAWSTAKTTGVSIVIAALAILSVRQYQAQAELRDENKVLSEKLARLKTVNDDLAAQRAQAPLYLSVHAPSGSSGPNHSANVYVPGGTNMIYLSANQIASYLNDHGRTASTLLAAFRTSGDKDLLREAMQKFPNDPQVDFEAAVNTNISGDEKRQWLNNFETNDPGNALPDYLSALNYFQNGQTNLAMQEFSTAAGKGPNDYNLQRVEDDVEVYLAAGYSLSDAKNLASSQLMLPQLAQIKQTAIAAVDIAKGFNQSGDTDSANAILQATMSMGQQYSDVNGPFEINQLVGIAIQKITLSAMDPSAQYGDPGQTVQDQIDQLGQQRQAWTALNNQTQSLYSQMNDQDWIVYRDREMMFGEWNALQWLAGKYGQK